MPTSAKPTPSKTKLAQSTYPPPFVVPPSAQPHTHTIILLHGRGGDGTRFGLDLLFSSRSSSFSSSSSSSSAHQTTLPAHFRTAKFVFPTASKRRSTVLQRVPVNQWFDNYSLEDPEQRPELQYEGIAETSAYVARLVEEEVALLGGETGRVVLGGLSQGCAAGLQVLLNWRGEGLGALGGFVGMSGWLPFAAALDPRSELGGHGKDEDEVGVVFGEDEEGDSRDAKLEKDGEGEGGEGRAFGGTELERIQLQAANTARDIASLPPLSGEPGDEPVFASTPVLLGHGRHDEKVSINLGTRARDVLRALGCEVQWAEYEEGHWYKVPEQIDDIVRFLDTVVVI